MCRARGTAADGITEAPALSRASPLGFAFRSRACCYTERFCTSCARLGGTGIGQQGQICVGTGKLGKESSQEWWKCGGKGEMAPMSRARRVIMEWCLGGEAVLGVVSQKAAEKLA